MSLQYVLWTVGLVLIWRYRVRTRALILREHAEADELGELALTGEEQHPHLR